MGESQSPEEIEAHLGPDGPVQAVRDWVALLVDDGDFGAAWERMTPEFRRERVAAWIDNNVGHPLVRLAGDRDDAIEALLAERQTHHLWEHFAGSELGQYREAWAAHETWGAFSKPRPVGPDLEIVIFMPLDFSIPIRYSEPTLVEGAIPFYVQRCDDGWLIGGWPPAA